MSEFPKNHRVLEDNTIDLIEVIFQLWAGRKKILLMMAIFVILGGVYLLFKKLTIIPEYESHVTLSVDEESQETLPIIIASDSFMDEVMKIKIKRADNSKLLSVLDVLNQNTIPPQGNIAGLMKRIMPKSEKSGTLEVTVVMQDPQMATDLTDSIIQKLGTFIQTFQSPRTLNNLNYLYARSRDAESSYRQSMKDLAAFHAQNVNKLRTFDSITEKRLKAESDLRFDIYRELMQQIEKVKIMAQERKPLFNIVQPATKAKQINSPDIEITLLILFLMGFFAGVALVFGKKLYDTYLHADR